MENHKDFSTSFTRLPTNLADLLETHTDVILIYSKKKNDVNVSTSETLGISADCSTINLTGTPLEVDLDVLPVASNTSKKWNQEETKYVPIKLKLARKAINEYNKEGTTRSKAVYCFCDGTDEKNILMLGSYHFNGIFTRKIVYGQDCVGETYPQNNINSMIDVHNENVGMISSKIETKVTCLYELYGHQLVSNWLLENVETIGSVLLEGTWNTCEYNIPRHGASLKMMLQVVVGHEDSIIYKFFEEFVFLDKCLKMLSNRQNIDDFKISSNSIDVTDLYKQITDILCEVNVIRKPNLLPNNAHDAVQNVKETNLTDKLWCVLKHCDTVSDIKFCFNHLFEMINDNLTRIHIFEDDKNTMVGKMISDIYAGRMIAPNLSSKQSLELFIELGLQKMRRNYFTIIKSCDFTIAELIQNKWNKVCFSLCETRRGTFAELNLSQGLIQFRFLFCIHVLLEFLLLVEEKCPFSKDVSLAILKQAYNKYVTETSPIAISSSLDLKQLYELTVPFTSIDTTLMRDYNPVKWQIKMVSALRDSTVSTVFHFSKKPMFSYIPNNFEDVNESSYTEEEKFHVIRMESYSDKIC